MTDDGLTQLIDAGPDPTNELQHLVMTRFRDITAARQLARGWKEIARALGVEGRQIALAAAYWRVSRAVDAGRLTVTVPKIGKTVANQGSQRAKPAAEEAQPAAPTTSGRQSTKEFWNSLEQIGGNKK